MGVLEKLSRLVVGGEVAAKRDAVEALRECYIGCVQRARRFAQLAGVAPQEYSIEALKQLAAAEEAQAGRLLDALRAAGAEVPGVADGPPAPGALNHWGRLVQSLEAHRLSARH